MGDEEDRNSPSGWIGLTTYVLGFSVIGVIVVVLFLIQFGVL